VSSLDASKEWRARKDIDSRSEDQTGNDDVLPRSGIEEMGSEYEKGVKPSSSLIDSLRDEIGREALLDLLLVLEGVVVLSVGHAGRANDKEVKSEEDQLVLSVEGGKTREEGKEEEEMLTFPTRTNNRRPPRSS